MDIDGNESRLHALLVDDHPVVVDAIAAALLSARLFHRIERANTLAGAHAQLAANPDMAVVVLDLHLPDAEGCEGFVALREAYPDVPIVVFSAESSAATITAAFESGVRGYITKDSPFDAVIGAIHPHRLRQFVEGVPAPVLTTALYSRFASQGADDFGNKVLSAMRHGFGGHVEKKS